MIFGIYYIQVVPGRAGGGSFKREKNYKLKKELPIECAQGTDQRDAETIFLL